MRVPRPLLELRKYYQGDQDRDITNLAINFNVAGYLLKFMKKYFSEFQCQGL